MKRFGVMLDMSRNAVMKPEEVVRFAKTIKTFGYNMIQLYTEDTYEVEGEPYFGYMRGRYSLSEQKYIVDTCENMGIEVIPCIQTLAHLNQIFRWNKYSKINDINAILLAEDEKTYAFIENMIKSLRKVFKSEYIHIGMDEAHMLGLGKYLTIHGYKKPFEILTKHLNMVVEICKKYNFKAIMWSDMYFRFSGYPGYYSEEPHILQEAIDATPKDVGLVFWDYGHEYQKIYDKMFEAHRLFDNETWFAGGAWTWMGFAPSNLTTLKAMFPAMKSSRENNIENIIITMWGDDGKECSFYSVLPSLFAIKKFYDDITDMDVIKKEFNSITGENFDDLVNLDIVNYVGGNKSYRNISKLMLYNDPFNGIYDTAVKEGGAKEFEKHAKTLAAASKNSKNYGYIFDSLSSLCDLLSVKYDLGYRLRKAYKINDKKALEKISGDFTAAMNKLEVFYNKFSQLWHKENKPQGFDVQDIRLGGLMQRLKSCKVRLDEYIAGNTKNIPELDEELLHWSGEEDPTKLESDTPHLNWWIYNASVNII